jgi:hypothetical protein
LSEAWSAFICSDFIDWQEYREPEGETDFLLALSPDGFHKDNISGGAPYGVFPELSWKPIWRNFEWTGVQFPLTALSSPPDFLSYLRTTILECAGFPAFLGLADFDRIRDHLLRSVLIFLIITRHNLNGVSSPTIIFGAMPGSFPDWWQAHNEQDQHDQPHHQGAHDITAEVVGDPFTALA